MGLYMDISHNWDYIWKIMGYNVMGYVITIDGMFNTHMYLD